MTNQELKDLVASIAIAQIKTDEQIKESRISRDEERKKYRLEVEERDRKTDIRLAKLEKFIDKETKDTKKLKDMIFGIGTSQGLVAEEFFQNSLKNKKTVAGITYDEIITNMNKRKKNIEAEYDIVLVNGKEIAIIEVKYNAHTNDLDKFLNIQYPKFKLLYPEYNNYKHNLMFASFHINDDFKTQALNNNITLLQRKGNIIETLLPA